jgi:cytochrome c5
MHAIDYVSFQSSIDKRDPPMLKRTTVLSLITLALLAGCGKEEPKEAPAAPEAAMPEAAPMEETAAPETTMPEVAPMEPAPSTEAAMPAPAAADTAQGKKVYDGLCFSCHTAGIAGAPKLGDKAAWAARIDQGMDTLYAHSINGFQGKSGVMPPKGGNMSLSDDEVKAAVDYMVAQSQ